jgi:hypothetical protein
MGAYVNSTATSVAAAYTCYPYFGLIQQNSASLIEAMQLVVLAAFSFAYL